MPGERFPLPRVQDCYDCANHCLDMWNDSVDHAAQSSLLRMAEAWLQLAFESHNNELNSREITTPTGIRRPTEPRAAPVHERYRPRRPRVALHHKVPQDGSPTAGSAEWAM
jgi:hypothetical protein